MRNEKFESWTYFLKISKSISWAFEKNNYWLIWFKLLMINECVKNTIICEFFLLFIKKKCVLTCDVCKNLDLMYTLSNLIILQFNLKKYNKKY